MKIFKFVKEYIFKYKFYVFIFLLFSICSWSISIITPYLTGNYIDVLLETKNNESIINFTMKIFIIGTASIISSFIVSYLYVKIQTKAAIDLNFHVLDHVVRMPILYFNSIDSTYLNQRINSDSNTVISFILGNLLDIITNALTIILLLYISIRINLKLTLILIPLIPLYLLLYFLFRKPLYKQGYDLKEKQNKFFSKMNEYLQNIKLIKTNATFKEAHNQVDNSFTKMLSSLLKYTRISYMFSSSNSMTRVISQIIIFFFGGMEIINGNLTVGQFTIINSYFSMIMNGTSYFLNFGKSYQDALVSYNRLNEILDEPKEINGETHINNIDTVELENVSFSYNHSKNVINNFNYRFQKGNVYCIIGENGIGKSTLINLILGIFNDYYNGYIYYNSVEIKELDMYSTRRRVVGISEQEPKLINNTIVSNITYGIDVYDYERINKLLEKLNLDIHKFKDGLNTNIHESANNISGGEKLKISLTRTFLKNPDIIILDEPTSALDINSIKKLKYLIKEIKEDKIILIITHDKEFLNIADKIIDLNTYTTKHYASSAPN